MSIENLIEAMHARDLALHEKSLDDGTDPNGKTDEGEYPLQIAYRYALHEAIGYKFWIASYGL